jgi:UDP-glucose 4-epimerase
VARVLITGAFGTLGRWVLAELARQGHDTTVLELDNRRNRGIARRSWVRVVWGDLRDPAAVAEAAAGQDVVIHMAFVLPPASERDPEGARAINVDGTRHVIAACRAQARPPRLLFCSSVEVFGKNRHLAGPRRVDDPVAATSTYTTHKIECEALVRESGLDFAIARFAAIIDISLASSHELMFEFPLDVRFEALHPADAARAVVAAIDCAAVWGTGKLLLLGGGPSCRTTYGEFLDAMMNTLGVGSLPAEAFTREDYPSDWLDSEESERLLQYQRHSLADIRAQIDALLGWRKVILPLVKPLVRRSILARSPYLGERSNTR